MSVVAKFTVNEVRSNVTGGGVKLNAVYPSEDPKVTTSDEDQAFWEATPQGLIDLVITNSSALEQFQAGDQFYVTFERIPKNTE